MEIKYCPNCGHEVQSTTNFCGKCGFSVGKLRERISEPVKVTQEQTTISKNDLPQDKPKVKLSSQVNEAKDKFKTAISDKDWAEKAQQYVSKNKFSQEQVKKVLSIVGAVVAILVLWFGWSWFQNRDFRQAVSIADSYFDRGEYGEAVQKYQEVRQMKPNDKKVVARYDQAKELGEYWAWINDNNFPNGASVAHKELTESMSNVKDKKAKKAYQEALNGIEQTSSYQIEERIEKKYKGAYGF